MKSCFCSIEDKISYFCNNEYGYFLNKKNVVGVGLGYKVQNGFNTCTKCIKVFVSHKVSVDTLCPNDIIPKFYKDIITDVVETGYILTKSLTTRVRPTICGYCIGPVGIYSSVTLGCIVKDKDRKYILTCCHNIIRKDSTFPIRIIQPSHKYGGLPIIDAVGQIQKYIPLKPVTPSETPKNLVDASITSIYDTNDVSSEIYTIGKLKGITTPKLNKTVYKSGAVTGFTKGKIIDINCTIEILKDTDRYILSDQIMTTPMATDGDSGAVLVNSGHIAVGLLTAGSDSCTVYSKIHNVLNMLNVELVID